MTMIDPTAPIAHPVWCHQTHHPDTALVGMPDGRVMQFAPAEPDEEHRGREYRIEAGHHLDFAVTVAAVQGYELAPPNGQSTDVWSPAVRLAVQDHSVIGPPVAVDLTLDDVDRLVVLLQRVRQDIGAMQ